MATIATLQTKIYNLTKTNSSSFTNANMLIDINLAYNQIIDWILEADGRWQWDDLNYNDLPEGTTTITADQRDYRFDSEHLRVLRVEIKDSNGNWHKLEPFDQEDVLSQSVSELETDTGVPYRYDVIGRSIFLDPTPDFTQTASLKVYFQRGPDEFTSAQLTTGTKVPGFVSTFHWLLAYMVALDYAVANGLKNANQLDTFVQRGKKELQAFYSKRNKDDRPRMTMRKILYK